MTHTPGPWRTNDSPTFIGEVILYERQPGRFERLDSDKKGRFMPSDARLIAAAPDLLAALQDCLTFDGATAERSHTAALRRLQAINDIAHAAINKATKA